MLCRKRAENHWLQDISTSQQRKHMWNQILAEVWEIFTVQHASKCQLPSLSSAWCYQHSSRVSSSVLWVSSFLFMTLSADMLVTFWAQALACWLWSQSCITCKRTAWHSSVTVPRNISQCTNLPGCARVTFHPTVQKAGLMHSVLKYTFAYLLPVINYQQREERIWIWGLHWCKCTFILAFYPKSDVCWYFKIACRPARAVFPHL